MLTTLIRRVLAPSTVFALSLAMAMAPSTAQASDLLGDSGVISDLEVVTPSADTYLQYHGKLIVTAGTRSAEYRWGGTSCGSRTLSAENIDMLVQVVRSGLEVTPRFQTGQAGAKCLVGFNIQKGK